MGLVFIVSSLVIVYSDDYVFGDLNYNSVYFIGFDICCFHNVFNC
jgi:methionyl-tRNA synthetase